MTLRRFLSYCVYNQEIKILDYDTLTIDPMIFKGPAVDVIANHAIPKDLLDREVIYVEAEKDGILRIDVTTVFN